MKRLTVKEMKLLFKMIHGDLYSYDKFTEGQNRRRISINCPIHGDFYKRAYLHLKGEGCPTCSKNAQKKNNRLKNYIIFFDFVNSLGDYSIEGEYINANSKIELFHKICGNKFKVTPGHFKNGTRCPYCIGRYKTTSDIKEEIYNLVGEEYTLIGEYTKAKDKIEMLHNYCGLIYNVKINKFRKGNRCPNCMLKNGSRLSLKVEEFLIFQRIEYRKEVRFKDCRNKLPLPFDYCLYDKGVLKLIIEVDGNQHRIPVEKFGGEEGLRKRILRDSIKSKFCKDISIPLIRITKSNLQENLEIILNITKMFLKVQHVRNNLQYGIEKELVEQVRNFYLLPNETINSCSRKFHITKYLTSLILRYEIYPIINKNLKSRIEEKLLSKRRYKLPKDWDKRQEMYDLKNKNWSYRKIGRKYGRSHNCVKKLISGYEETLSNN